MTLSVMNPFSKKSSNGLKIYHHILTLQRLKHVGFLYTFTSKYTRKHMRLMIFYKTFTTKDTIASISDSIRLVSKPIYIYSLFKLRYYIITCVCFQFLHTFLFCTIHPTPNGVGFSHSFLVRQMLLLFLILVTNRSKTLN